MTGHPGSVYRESCGVQQGLGPRYIRGQRDLQRSPRPSVLIGIEVGVIVFDGRFVQRIVLFHLKDAVQHDGAEELLDLRLVGEGGALRVGIIQPQAQNRGGRITAGPDDPAGDIAVAVLALQFFDAFSDPAFLQKGGFPGRVIDGPLRQVDPDGIAVPV